jgi:GT2 family glycosyltransferase
MKLSVIILNYNVSYFLRQCILTVQEALAGIESEIIIIDNDSKDDSCEIVKKHFPNIKLIENKENVGFSKANNQGVAIAKGEYVCILNPDTAVAKETFRKALEFAETKKDLGALGIRLIDGTGNYLPESKRNIPSPKVSLYKILGIKSNTFNYYATQLADNETGEVSVLVGAFMLLKTEVYKKVGGFDEDYFMYGEDIDLSYKLLKANYKNYYLGDVTMLHYKGESTTKDKNYLKRFYGAMHIFFKKHFKTGGFFKTLVFSGVTLLRFINIFRTSRVKTPAFEGEHYYLLSDNIGFMQKLSAATEIKFKSMAKSAVTDSKIFDSCFVFDANYVAYEKIFTAMEFLKNKGNIFRIRPVNTDFILGSDSSTSKGEIFDMTKNKE